MWISFSPDLHHWGDHQVLIESRRTGHWDREKIGLCPPPLRTKEGWLVLFHGVKATAAGALYPAGLAMIQLDDSPRSWPAPTNGSLAPRLDTSGLATSPASIFFAKEDLGPFKSLPGSFMLAMKRGGIHASSEGRSSSYPGPSRR